MDELPELRYGGEMVRPERDSYSYTPPWGVTKSNIEGTLSRLNRRSFGGPANVSCVVQLNSPAKLQWWDDFYNYTIAEGSQRFASRTDLRSLCCNVTPGNDAMLR